MKIKMLYQQLKKKNQSKKHDLGIKGGDIYKLLHRVTEKILPEKSFWLCKYAINKMKTKIAQIVLFHSKDFKKVTKM